MIIRLIRVLRQRLRSLFRRRTADEELARELDLHMEQLVREHLAAGLPESEARQAARRAFGAPDLAREQCRDMRRVGLLEDLGTDTAYALRLLARSPAFTVTAILSLALGIGANTAIYSLVDAVLLRTLPVERPHDLFFLQVVGSESRGGAPPYPCFERIRTEASAFAGLAAFASDHLRVEVDGAPEQVFGQVVSGNYFQLLGVKPTLGRLMTMADEALNPPVAVISYGYWHQRFGGKPDAIGRTLVFRDRIFTIVGVTPPEFGGLQPGQHVDVTLPISQQRSLLTDAGAWWFEAVGRIAAGAHPTEAAAQADTVFQSFMKDHGRGVPELRRKYFDRLQVSPAWRGLDGLSGRFAMPLYLTAAIGAVVLLIACTNLGSLLLARGEMRSREMAIRIAAGAGAARVVRQLVTETLLLFVLGTVAGLLVARLILQTTAAFFAIGRSPILLDIRYDWRLAVFAAGIALVTGLLTALWPALRALATDPNATLKDGDIRVIGSRRSFAGGRMLIAAQMTLSMVLLVAALLFGRTMINLRGVDLGFSSSRVLTMSMDVVLPEGSPASAREPFHRRVLERVRALPGVDAASLSVLTPLSGRDTGKFVTVPGFEPRGDIDRMVHLNHVSEDYFRTFGVRLVSGRAFTPDDRHGALKVAILNEAAVQTYFAARSPLGATITLGNGDRCTVVGVVSDYKHMSVREPAPRFVFVPMWQPLDPVTRVTLAVASDLPTADLARAVASEVRIVHARTLVSDVVDVARQIDATLIGERLLSTLASGFAAVALVLACIGLYGTLSYSVARRRNELGIRVALGARPAQIAVAIAGQTLRPVAVGLIVGLPLALLVARAAEGMLFGLSALDPAVYIGAAVALGVVGAIASIGPARRAATIRPIESIRVN